MLSSFGFEGMCFGACGLWAEGLGFRGLGLLWVWTSCTKKPTCWRVPRVLDFLYAVSNLVFLFEFRSPFVFVLGSYSLSRKNAIIPATITHETTIH